LSSASHLPLPARAPMLLAAAKPRLLACFRIVSRAGGSTSRSSEPSVEALSTRTVSKSVKVCWVSDRRQRRR
jgi:hypothetical protein